MPAVAPSAGTWAVVLLLALGSGLTTVIGVALAIRLEKSARAVAVGIGFSAGIMLLISAAELLPASFRAAGAAWTWGGIVLGAGLIAALHVVIPHVHLFEERGLLDTAMFRTGALVALGLILHDVPEGVAMASAARVDGAAGRGPPRPRRPDLPHRDLLLPGGFRAARRGAARRAPAGAEDPGEAAERPAARSRLHARDHGAPGGQSPLRRDDRRAPGPRSAQRRNAGRWRSCDAALSAPYTGRPLDPGIVVVTRPPAPGRPPAGEGRRSPSRHRATRRANRASSCGGRRSHRARCSPLAARRPDRRARTAARGHRE